MIIKLNLTFLTLQMIQ